MRRIARLNIFFITAAMALLTVPIAAAQPAPDPPAAPIPKQILTGKKVFISNGESTGDTEFRVSNLAYNAFYANMKNWGGYELVSAPADADLVFDPSFVLGFEVLPLRLRLVILDPKTHIALWTFTEHVQPWSRESTGRKNFDQAMAKLVDDVKKLTATTDAAASK
jgi:hypothetical protein